MWTTRTRPSFEALEALSLSEESDHSPLIEGVNDSWSESIVGFEPTAYELGLLARRYVSLARSLDEYVLCGEKKRGPSLVEYFATRLAAIQKTLGRERYEFVVGWKVEKLTEMFDGLRNQEQALAPCRTCGAVARLGNQRFIGGYCSNCQRAAYDQKLLLGAKVFESLSKDEQEALGAYVAETI
jgi:hypothetical protein